jgi:hypothetical protein
MRRIMLAAVGLGMFLTSNVAMAHGWNPYGHHRRPAVRYYRPVYGYSIPAPYYGHACGAGYGYGAGYPSEAAPYAYPAYPQPGIGLAARNFSLWLTP